MEHKTYHCPNNCVTNDRGGMCPRCGASMKYMGYNTREKVEKWHQENQLAHADELRRNEGRGRNPRLNPNF